MLVEIITNAGCNGVLTPDKSMADLSWLKVGGAAQWLYQPSDFADLQRFLKAIPPEMPISPIGVCSNLIIREGGIDGVVIRLGRGFNTISITGNHLTVGSAALDAHVARKAAAAGLDLTFLRTIPGAIGGAVKMNAGCYGRYLADVFVSAIGIDRAGEKVSFTKNDLKFIYRSSMLPDDTILTSVVLTAQNGDPETLNGQMEDALAKRAATQPVKARSCGSTFRNPAGFSSTGQADDVHDLKAWKLIDDAGLRGATLGGAQMSEMHPNFLINTGNATADDLETLGEKVRKRVFENSGIQLQWEIRRIGKPVS